MDSSRPYNAIDESISLLEYVGYQYDESSMLSAKIPFNITYLTNDRSYHISVAQILQQDFAVFNINMTIDTRLWNVFSIQTGQLRVWREGCLTDFINPIQILEMWTSTSINNDRQFGH